MQGHEPGRIGGLGCLHMGTIGRNRRRIEGGRKTIGGIAEMSKEKDLRELLQMGVEVVEDFMPNIGNCVLQDYGRVNEFLIKSKEELKDELQTNDRST